MNIIEDDFTPTKELSQQINKKITDKLISYGVSELDKKIKYKVHKSKPIDDIPSYIFLPIDNIFDNKILVDKTTANKYYVEQHGGVYLDTKYFVPFILPWV